MIKNNNFDIVEVSDEFIAVPIGEEAVSFHGVIVLSEPAAFLLKHMNTETNTAELVDLLVKEYEVTRSVAESDIDEIMHTFRELNLILDN